MSTNENPAVTDDDDLDAFSADFFGQKPATPTPASEEKDETPADPKDDAKLEEDTHLGEDDTPANDEPEDEPEEDGEEDEDEDPEPKPEPKKKSRAQERIEELNAKYREEQRQRELLEARLAKLEQKETPAPAKVEVVEDTGPTPDDKLDDGTDKYPLGEFDPNYIRDLTKFTIQQEREAAKQADIQDQNQKAIQEQKTALAVEWEGKLVPARERYPDFQEKGEQLISQFDGIDQNYGEYLTATIMSMEYGTDVLYHLASNPDEAKAIVASGPTKATIALGRLEAKFANVDAEKQLARPKVSKAPAPPAHVNKGSAVAKVAVSPDTDDLDAFSSEFFKKGRK